MPVSPPPQILTFWKYLRQRSRVFLAPAQFQAAPSAGLVLYLEAEPGFYGNTARVEGK